MDRTVAGAVSALLLQRGGLGRGSPAGSLLVSGRACGAPRPLARAGLPFFKGKYNRLVGNKTGNIS